MIRQNQKLQALLGGQRSARVTMGTLKERQVVGPDCSGHCWPVWCVGPGICWSQGLSDLARHLLEDGFDLRPGGVGPL